MCVPGHIRLFYRAHDRLSGAARSEAPRTAPTGGTAGGAGTGTKSDRDAHHVPVRGHAGVFRAGLAVAVVAGSALGLSRRGRPHCSQLPVLSVGLQGKQLRRCHDPHSGGSQSHRNRPLRDGETPDVRWRSGDAGRHTAGAWSLVGTVLLFPDAADPRLAASGGGAVSAPASARLHGIHAASMLSPDAVRVVIVPPM